MELRLGAMRLVALLLLLATRSEQRGDGAPTTACLDMTPVHSDIVAQTSLAPYVVLTSAAQVRQGDVLNVTIAGPAGQQTPVGGFMLQARSVQDRNKILGQFVSVPDPVMEKMSKCQNDGDTVTHTSPQPKRDLTFQWRAPADFLGSVAFRATVAQSYAVFWKNIESSLVEVVGPNTPVAVTQRAKTTSGYAGPPLNDNQTTKSSIQLDPIYRGCADTKLCFGTAPDCVSKGNCPAVVAVHVAGDTFTFEVQAIGNPTYVAAGLSNDLTMGDDSAMECVRENGKIGLFSSWTYPKTEPYVSRGVPQSILTLLETSNEDGKLYCRFTRETNTTVMGVNFDLKNKKYNLMVVAGSSMKEAGKRVGYHDLAFDRTGVPVHLAQVGTAGAASKLLLRLHGAFMVAAWLGTASLGILLARYFRQTWVGKQLGGKDIWFAWHRVLMVLTWLLTMSAFVLILIEVGGYQLTGDNPHAITGLVTVILCFLQPIGAYFRPHPGTSKRPVFNWLHWLGGNAAHILAIATIFLSVYLSKAELPAYTVYILAAYVVFHVVLHLVLSVTVCVSDGRISNGRVNSFPMKDMLGNRSAAPVDRKTDAPYGGFRRLILGVYIVVAALFTIAVVCLVALAPIDQTVSSVSSALNQVMGADRQ